MAGQSSGTSQMSLHILSGTLIARMNNELLFGAELAGDRDFEKDSIKYGWDIAIAMEIFRQIPTSFVPFVSKIYMTWSGSMHRVTSRVQTLVNERIQRAQFETQEKQSQTRHLDGLDWVISSSNTPEQKHPLRTAQQMMALLFASTHQMQMAVSWAILDLCLHPKYIDILRNEIEAAFAVPEGDPYSRLRVMECFLRESSRLNPLDSCTNYTALKCESPVINVMSSERTTQSDGAIHSL
jgi:cytochrome P450